VKFDQFEWAMHKTLEQINEGNPSAKGKEIKPERLPPLVLAYIGDAVFNLYVRNRLLSYEQNKVRILHSYGAKMVSATFQAYALRQMEKDLTEQEMEIIRKGRNAKSSVPKSASVADYRSSTGFEALLGYLFLEGKQERINDIAEQCFIHISRKLKNNDDNKGENR